MLDAETKRAIVDGRFEQSDEGVLVPETRTLIQGIVQYAKRGEPVEQTHNLIVNQGLNYLLEAATGGQSPITTWYVAVFTGDVSVQSSWTASNFASNATEFTQYEAGSRPSWSPGSVASGARDSFSSKAEFKSTTDGAMIRGAALISSSTKGGTGGVLMGATRFNNAKPLDEDEILDVGYGLQVTAVT